MGALARLQKQIVGFHVLGSTVPEARLLVSAQLHLQGGDDFVGDLVLYGEDVFEVAVVAFRPQVAAIVAVDELGVDAHAIAGLAYASLERRPHPELTAHLLEVG